MVHVAKEMEREGFELPLLIGGATTSAAHTAVKIAPEYAEPVVHVLDASRVVGVVSKLLSDTERPKYVGEIRNEYIKVREAHVRSEASKRRITLAAARANKFSIDWSGYKPPKPTFLGTKVFTDYPLAELVPYIDWTPFFQTWELTGRYPAILKDNKVGAEAQKLFNDARDMLKRMVAEKWTKASGVIGFWPANSVGDDIELFTDDTRSTHLETLYTLRQQIARDPSRDRAHTALADFVAPKDTGLADYVGGFAVTAGIGEEESLQSRIKDNGRLQPHPLQGAGRSPGGSVRRAPARARAPRVLGLCRRPRRSPTTISSPRSIAAFARRRAIRRSPTIPRRRRSGASWTCSGRPASS